MGTIVSVAPKMGSKQIMKPAIEVTSFPKKQRFILWFGTAGLF